MSSPKNRLRLAASFAVLLVASLGVACKGFFVNPTVTSITIDPPDPSVSIGLTAQLTAAGTDSNGNALTLTGGSSCTGTTVCWSSDTPAVATVSTGGLLTGVSAGTSTITAASGTASATTTATVTLANVTNIMIVPNNNFSLPESTTASGTDCLTVQAASGGKNIDVTTSVTWQTSDTTILQVENGVDPMCVQSLAVSGQATVFAQYVSGTVTLTSNSITVTVQ